MYTISSIGVPSQITNGVTEWETFLQDLFVVEWADDMVMQALADMSVNIDVLTTIRTDECPESHYTCQDQPVGTNTIGLIEERHYVGLERLQTVNHQEEQSSQGSRREKDTEDLNSLPMKLHCLLTNSPLC